MGLGSKDSSGDNSRFGILPYTCFSSLASQIFRLLSFLLQGDFHLHGYEVTGMGLSSSSESGVECLLNSLGDIAARACNNAETWVHEADFLHKKMIVNFFISLFKLKSYPEHIHRLPLIFPILCSLKVEYI